ncbi:hypothetical protein FZEAL_52 [Fusarium zealandicum]|uniref:Ubiquitin-conjugating enzyme E2C-binding protein n=1 Tax=Fusarium zealandicum TaxID=1053134 RepID=A0A8H4UVK9_9HYPO|nr:hypothetical protein FZEAL_52 [Fusarium zealandicum]
MTSSKAISIYAELLSNIRNISVVASLSSAVDSSTKAEISQDGRHLTVTHQDQTENIFLPAQAAVTASLPVAGNGRSSLSWRLPISPAEAKPAHFLPENQALPWTSVDVKAGSRIGCRKCDSEFVAQNTIKAWKDLPSENWAEMMEFWHCHKPHDHNQQDSESLASKGYGANHVISAQEGVGFVDLTSYLFLESEFYLGLQPGEKEDVHTGTTNLSVIWPSIQLPKINAFVVPTTWAGKPLETFLLEWVPEVTLKTQPPSFNRPLTDYRLAAYTLQYSSSTVDAGFDISSLALDDDEAKKFLRVFCQKCEAEVGLFNILALSVTLFKWQITCQTNTPNPSPSSSECLAATLVATISRSGSSKSIITPHILGPAKAELDGPQTHLYLWVLNPNVVYTSSFAKGSKTAMKILYRHIGAEEGDKLTTSMVSDVQEITLPSAAIKAAEEYLSSSSHLLPAQERTFKEWNVGLLGRWEPAP